MGANHYHFVTEWDVAGDVHEVFEVIDDALDLPRWWPSVYLAARELQPGDERGVGKVIALHTRGRLPYTLRWEFRVVEKEAPRRVVLDAWGDFVGRAVLSFVPVGERVRVTYDWKIRADKALLRYFSWVMKPIFSANHHWAMARGEESLVAELARRRALESTGRHG